MRQRVFEMYEDKIIRWLADGLTQFEISELLPMISEPSVNKYVKGIVKKHGAKNTPNLVSIAYQKGILKP